MAKVRMLTSFAGNPPMNMGEVYDVSQESAELLISRGQAEIVAPLQKSAAKKQSGKSDAVSKSRRNKKAT